MEKRNIITLPSAGGGPQWQVDIHVDEYLQRVDHRVSTVTRKPLHEIKLINTRDPSGLVLARYRGVFSDQNQALRARDNFLHPTES